MGNRTTVANNQQIVEGIEAGVASGVWQALAAMGTSNNDDRPVELVVKVGEAELGRASYKSLRQLERRGEIQMAFA